MIKVLMAYLKDEEGQTSTEYILLLVVVALFVTKFKKAAGDKLTGLTGTVFDKATDMAEEIGQER